MNHFVKRGNVVDMSKAMSFPLPEQPVRSAHPVHPVHPVRTRKLTRPIYPEHESLTTFIGAVSCPVCDAVYAPAQSHEHLLHAPAIALESAFMSMCRFCFRCRRPSCPECWDSVNGLCGSCVQELALPFRLELAPFVGALPVKSSSRQTASLAIPHQLPSTTSDAPLRCVYTGRFQQTAQDVLADALITTDPVPVAQQNFPAQPTSITASARQQSIQADIEAQPAQPPVPQLDSQQSSPSRVASISERVFTTLFLTLLSVLVLLVISASLSTQANAVMAQFLHIDIRAFILSVWSLIHQILGH